MLESWSEPVIALLQIMTINVVLSADNAVVIALACGKLSLADRRQAFMWGSVGAVVLRAVLTVFVVFLLGLPYLEIAGSVLLLWIGVKLLVAEGGKEPGIGEKSTLIAAIKTIIVADIIMSLDNVLAMAGAARGHTWMLIAALVVTVPVILFGSALLIKLMDRFPVIIIAGAAMIGWVAGDMLVADPVLKDWVRANAPYLDIVAPVLCAIFVVATGRLVERSRSRTAI